MWRIPRPSVFSRWKHEPFVHRNIRLFDATVLESPNNSTQSFQIATSRFAQLHRRTLTSFSNKYQHNHKKYTFWHGTNFHCSNFPPFFETVSWLGTAVVLCLNIQHKICTYHHQRCYEDCSKHQQRHAHSEKSCIPHRLCYGFSSLLPYLAFTMPRSNSFIKKQIFPENSHLFSEAKLQNESSHSQFNDKVSSRLEESRQELEDAATTCIVKLENLTALQLVEKSPRQAVKYFKAAGELGSSQAHFNLGVCYETGKGTEVNLKKAAYHYQQASESGHILATYNLGVYFWEGKGGIEKNPEMAIKLICRAAQQGMALAQVFMGIHYYEQENFSEAVISFTSAAVQKDADAQYYLAVCYENGLGVPEDLVLAGELYTAAASLGHNEAIYNLAYFYEQGLGGLPQDVCYAAELYQKASDNGHLEAKTALNHLEKLLRSKSLADKSCDNGINKNDSSFVYNKSDHNILHASSSSPELCHLSSSSCDSELPSNFTSSQYLNLILPTIVEHSIHKKNTLYIEEETIFNMSQPQMVTWPRTLNLLAANT